MYEARFRIRSTQVDQLGHLNNASYMELFEWTRWEWAESTGHGFAAMMRDRGIGPVLVRIEARFRREVRFHEHVRVTAELVAIRGKVGVIAQQMWREDGELAAEVTAELLVIDLAARRVVPFPSEFAAFLAAGA